MLANTSTSSDGAGGGGEDLTIHIILIIGGAVVLLLCAFVGIVCACLKDSSSQVGNINISGSGGTVVAMSNISNSNIGGLSNAPGRVMTVVPQASTSRLPLDSRQHSVNTPGQYPGNLPGRVNQFDENEAASWSIHAPSPQTLGTVYELPDQVVANNQAQTRSTEIESEKDIHISLIDRDKITISEKELGRGGYGTVWEGKFRGEQVAVKQLSSADAKPNHQLDLLKEALLLAAVIHPYCLRVKALCQEPLMTITEYMVGGSLENVLRDSPVTDRMKWAKQTSQAIAWLHSRKPRIIHGDIKPANVLLDAEKTAKIADFGLATIRDKASGTTTDVAMQKNSKVRGTVRYMAPELLRGEKDPSRSSDAFAVGILYYELAFLAPPGACIQEELLDQCMRRGWELKSNDMFDNYHLDYEERLESERIPIQYFVLIERLIYPDKTQRLTVDNAADMTAKIPFGSTNIPFTSELAGEGDQIAVVSLIDEVAKWEAVADVCKEKRMFFYGVWDPSNKGALKRWKDNVLALHKNKRVKKKLAITYDMERNSSKHSTSMTQHQIPYLREEGITFEELGFTQFMRDHSCWN